MNLNEGYGKFGGVNVNDYSEAKFKAEYMNHHDLDFLE